MANGVLVTDSGRKICIHRTFETSPTLTAPQAWKVGTGTTTPDPSDTDLDTAISIGGGSSKAVVSGYPIFDDTNMISTMRGILLTTECNGNDITESGLINADGTPLLFSRAVFTPITKTSSVQVILVEKDRVRRPDSS